MLEMMLENTFPIAGPSNAKMTITTTATKTRINAYSTKPCPFSRGMNNIFVFTSFSLQFAGNELPKARYRPIIGKNSLKCNRTYQYSSLCDSVQFADRDFDRSLCPLAQYTCYLHLAAQKLCFFL